MNKTKLPHVSAKSPSNISPKPLRSHIQRFETVEQLFKIPPLSDPIFFIGIIPFLLLRSRCTISEIYNNSGRRKKKKNSGLPKLALL
jgi:hypothetical protein